MRQIRTTRARYAARRPPGPAAPGIAALVSLVLLAALAGPARAQQPGQVVGRVLTPAGEPATDAEIALVELRRRTTTDAEGAFRFENVPPGSYLVEAVSPRAGSALGRVDVAAGGEARLDLTLDLVFHADEVVVTVSPEARGLSEVYQPVGVLSGNELTARRQPTLGETLNQEPGVSSTYFGPGASRPVIRGLGGDRIRILESGIGTGDASSTSPDHAVSVDPLGAESIEIVRGPATLLYGSSAVGGVVNVIDGRIPTYVPDALVTGALELGGGTVSDELRGSLALDGRLGERLAWHADYLRRDTEDYDIPGFAEAGAEEEHAEGEADGEAEEAFGVLPNSALESEAGSVGLSYVAESGFVGASFTGFDTFYGIPGAAHAHEEGEGEGAEEEQEGAVRIDLQQRRVDVRGEVSRPFAVFRGLRARLGVADYEHVELEGEEVGTRFTNDYWEGRLEALHRPLGRLTGAVGVQLARRDFTAVGEEAFLPPSETETRAVFAFEEIATDPWRFQAGARYERQDASTAELDRSFEGLSASVGAVWLPSANYAVAISLSRSVKLPNAEELFSDGPHVATRAFEIGDPDLDNETSLGADLSLRKLSGRLTGELNLFANRFDDFIFEELTGAEEDGLRVLRYVQRDASFAGGELHADVELVHAEPHHLTLELTADAVRAELVDGDEPLPRIPPIRLGGGLHYRGDRFWGLAEVRRVNEQDRVAPLEEPTGGYTFLNVSLGYRFFAAGLVHELVLRGTNLTDEEARDHVSFLKDVAPLPGRDVSLAYRLAF